MKVCSDLSEATRTGALLSLLRAHGICTLMVEGGARVIASFLAAPCVVNTLLITTEPLLVGSAGVSYVVPPSPVRLRELYFIG